MRLACCVDFGSTFTKALLVDLDSGEVLGTAAHRTTIATDVMEGYDACRLQLAELHPDAGGATVLACSSAGGGLRIAVVGQEELVTAEAGRRVALSSGGLVVDVLSLPHDDDSFAGLVHTSRADVVLLTGGTDGGNAEPLLEAARRLAASPWEGPVVVAGNVAARDEVGDILRRKGLPVVLADNVVPRIGVLAPESARGAVREMFLKHVIGGKHLSSRPEFAEMVRGATPDIVLTGVEVLSRSVGDVAVIDVGGATTDVHSAVRIDPEEAELAREVVALTPLTRTVEGDLGMRWSAASTVDAAIAAGLLDERLRPAGVRRSEDPGFLPSTADELDEDERIATAATVLAVRRHVGRSRARTASSGGTGHIGTDLREVDLLIGSGGVLRSADPERAARILGAVTGESREGWQQPEHPGVVVDHDYVLAAVGLLAEDHPDTAARLAASLDAAVTRTR